MGVALATVLVGLLALAANACAEVLGLGLGAGLVLVGLAVGVAIAQVGVRPFSGKAPTVRNEDRARATRAWAVAKSSLVLALLGTGGRPPSGFWVEVR